MKNLLLILLLFLPTAACMALTPEQKSAAVAEADGLLDRGEITEAQHEAILEAIESGGASIDWEALGYWGITIVFGLLGIPVAVRRTRNFVASRRRPVGP